MRVIFIILMLLIAMLESNIRADITIALTILWLLYTIYIYIKLLKEKDKKIISKNTLNNAPSDSSASHIRYFYKKMTDNKVFISIIFDLLRKKSISLVRQNGEYYFIDNKVIDEVLAKSEENTKKLLFTEMGNKENTSLLKINNAFRKNSGYIYNEYKSFKNSFEYECTKEKYFISNKKVIDNTMFYFILSMIIAIYDLLFLGKLIYFLSIFFITCFIIRVVNNFKNIENNKKSEYKSWLEFKNYIDSDIDISNLDVETLESYSLYAYVLDSYDNFKRKLNNMYMKDNNCFNNSILLSIMNAGVFDYLVKEINKDIKICEFKSIVLFARNKGRR